MPFKKLAIGAAFVFSSEVDPQFRYSGLEKGPWKKVSARKYVKLFDPEFVCTVGSLSVSTISWPVGK